MNFEICVSFGIATRRFSSVDGGVSKARPILTAHAVCSEVADVGQTGTELDKQVPRWRINAGA
ncbi:hypothetical protein [Mesorhizobium kowhaii]|uniref:hypothetical protein n=1 Tax=Mesorhizobium kowhaii TaxID=1300272 RepID=UPI00142E848C|nr:hypothetical protein [Mesorhizobium kowhaii]